MRIPLRSAVVLTGGATAAVVATIGWAVTRPVVMNVLAEEVREHMREAVALAAERLQRSQGTPLDSLTESLALTTGYRVSVFSGDATLLADPDFTDATVATGATTGEASQAGDRSEERPEVVAALDRLTGSSHRASSLDSGRSYLFSARRLYWQGEAVVLRLGTPVAPLAEKAGMVALAVAATVLLIFGVVILVLGRYTGRLTQELTALSQLLSRLSAGETTGSRLGLSRVVELARVTSTANRMRGQLEEHIALMNRERDELAQLMDLVAEGLMALTSDARILRINPAAKELLGLTEVPPFAPVGSVVRDPVLRDLLQESVIRTESRLELTLGDREVGVRTKRGVEGGSIVLMVDITEIRRLEAVRSDFVANASHELKTPLTVIRGAAETVLDEGLPEHLRRSFLRSIESNTVRLQRLVEDLLDLSRYESGAWRPERAAVSVGQVARAVWEEQEKDASVQEVEFSVSGEALALGDEGAIYQVFRNLIENALRYVPEEKGQIRVTIKSSEEKETVATSVKDNGTGIPAASLPRIFERFYRVDTARSREEGGTGLGLAIVRHLVSSMGGTVSATSTLGSGTAISFSLPVWRVTEGDSSQRRLEAQSEASG